MQTIAALRNPALAFPFPVAAKAVLPATPARLPGRPMRLRRGQPVYAEGTVVRDLYKVVSGSIRTCRILPDGRRMVASFALPGEVFGLDGPGTHRVCAEAIAESVVIAFARQEIEDCVDREPGAAHCWQAFTLERLSAAEDRCLMLGRMSAAERVAGFLLDIERRGLPKAGVIELPMSRYDIADHLGLTAETVSRVLSRFRKCGIIADQGLHCVRLLDRSALEDQAGDGGE
jgi:CRP-like cAMP-binding protein